MMKENPPHLQPLLHLLNQVKMFLWPVVQKLRHGALPLDKVAKVGSHLKMICDEVDTV